MRHKSLALSSLNQLLTTSPGEISEASILTVTVLLLNEAIFGNVEAVMAHRRGLKQMVQIYGGEEVLGPEVATVLHLADGKGALVGETVPVFGLRPYVRHRFERVVAGVRLLGNDDMFSAVGARFFEPVLGERMSAGVHECLVYARHLVGVVERYGGKGGDAGLYGIDDFTAMEHRLLCLPFEIVLDELEECVRIALLLYLNLSLWKTPFYFGWVHILVSKLKIALLALDLQDQGLGVHQLVLWMLFLGTHATSDEDTVEMSWWISKLRLVIQTLGLTESVGFAQVLEGFFYVDRISRSQRERVWGAAMSDKGGLKMESVTAKHPCNYFE
jgi:hypothetical protein